MDLSALQKHYMDFWHCQLKKDIHLDGLAQRYEMKRRIIGMLISLTVVEVGN